MLAAEVPSSAGFYSATEVLSKAEVLPPPEVPNVDEVHCDLAELAQSSFLSVTEVPSDGEVAIIGEALLSAAELLSPREVLNSTEVLSAAEVLNSTEVVSAAEVLI